MTEHQEIIATGCRDEALSVLSRHTPEIDPDELLMRSLTVVDGLLGELSTMSDEEWRSTYQSSEMGKRVEEVEMSSCHPHIIGKVLDLVKTLDYTSIRVKEVSFYREECKVRDRRDLGPTESQSGDDGEPDLRVTYTGKTVLKSHETWLGYQMTSCSEHEVAVHKDGLAISSMKFLSGYDEIHAMATRNGIAGHFFGWKCVRC